MRKSLLFFMVIVSLLIADGLLIMHMKKRYDVYTHHVKQMHILVEGFGLSDISVTTEARYTRHPAVSDGVVPFMDHPFDIEHFPSGSFFRPVQ